MRVAVQTLGTRGDIQPFVALALRLISRGHTAQIAAPSQFERLVCDHGIGFAALPAEFLDLLDTPEAAQAIGGGKGFSAGFKLLKHVRPLMRRLMDDETAAARAFGPDVIVYHPKSLTGPHLAESLRVPAILASPLPGFTPTAAFPTPLLPFRTLGPLNRVSHALATRSSDMLFGRDLGRWRRESLGLGTVRRSPAPAGTLYAYSPSVLPVPADYGKDVLVSGYWFLDSPAWQPPPALAAFLAAGRAPIYVGFGSMPGVDADQLTRTLLEGARMAGRRAVMATGGGALAGVADARDVFVIDQAPHDRLLPLMDGAVHHGGAGTTAAVLRAGKPSLVMPFFGDQPFWARRLQELGVAPPPLNRKRLTPEVVARALQHFERPEARGRAKALSSEIAEEDGLATAAAFIEAQVGDPVPRSLTPAGDVGAGTQRR